MTMSQMKSAPLRRCAFVWSFVILNSSFIVPAHGHPADISHLKVKIEPQRLEFRLTFNLYTLLQFHRLDIDNDGRITKQELDAGELPLRDYLARHVLITINGEDSDLGDAKQMERMWPADSAGSDVVAPDFAQRFVDFTFVKEVAAVVETVWIGFDIFKQTGDLHTVQAVFEQDGKPAEVLFSLYEPEYLWETGFSEAIKSPVAPASVTEPAAAVEKRGISTLVVVIGILAIAGTWLLLRKVRRIARGSFYIGPRE
jgi:hypothetical protein